ncbi:hypothetical protein [Mycobacterium riyadhense]|nr:hypothetical protein [Mycobacterium riyadhense]
MASWKSVKVAWCTGLDVFDVQREECPIEMRWLVYRKTVEAAN